MVIYPYCMRMNGRLDKRWENIKKIQVEILPNIKDTNEIYMNGNDV